MSCIKQQAEEPELLTTSNTQFLASLRESWERPYEQSAFLKDIPRLIRRVQVQTRDGVMHTPGTDDKSKVEATVALVELISHELNVEEVQVQDICSKLNSGYLTDTLTEEHSISHIFSTLNAEGSIIKTLKLINQGVVLHAMSVLREEVFTDIMTKDVRTPDGWKIVLRLGDVIELDHIRMEQSLDEFGDTTNHFEVQWMVMITFDKSLEQVRACSIRILRLTPAETMSPEQLRFLRNTLIEGLIVL